MTLVGETYRPRFRLVYSAGGDLVNLYASGVLARVPLPDGSTFMAAGRLDFLAHTEDFVATPDTGTLKNLDTFCAVLAG